MLRITAPSHPPSELITLYMQIKNHPVKAQPSDQAGSVILAKEPVLQVNFDLLKCDLVLLNLYHWHRRVVLCPKEVKSKPNYKMKINYKCSQRPFFTRHV